MRNPSLTDTGTLSNFVAKGRTLPAVFLPANVCMHAEKYIITDPIKLHKKDIICTNFPSLVPRPGRRRKEGLVPIAHTCANYPKKTWDAENDCTLILPSSHA